MNQFFQEVSSAMKEMQGAAPGDREEHLSNLAHMLEESAYQLGDPTSWPPGFSNAMIEFGEAFNRGSAQTYINKGDASPFSEALSTLYQQISPLFPGLKPLPQL
jgi:hypothetical protein